MNNNVITNPKTEVEKGIELNDKDYISCLLSNLKEMEKNYCIALTEASNEELYQQYKKAFDSLSTLQRETYQLMFKKGWYKLEKAEEKKVGMKYNCLQQEYKDLETED